MLVGQPPIGAPMAGLVVAVVTVSDSRSLRDDHSGDAVCAALQGAGHRVAHRAIVRDDAAAIATEVRQLRQGGAVVAVVLTGGTGVTPRDVTPEAIRPLLSADLPGFGELFRLLSYQQVGAAALLSRAFAGFSGPMLIIALPGAPAAVELALTHLVLPQIESLVRLHAGTAVGHGPHHAADGHHVH